jgi:ABC-type multidrug transport system permease subunit
MKRLTMKQVNIVDAYVTGNQTMTAIAKRYRCTPRRIGYILVEIAGNLGIDDIFMLCVYWCCPLFRVGLRELRLLPRR